MRAHGDTKTEKSRRTLELPGQAADALREHRARQAQERLAAGPLWHDHGLVFASQAGTRHQLRPVITKGAETMNTIFSQHNQAKSA